MAVFVGVVQEGWVRLAEVGKQGGGSGILQAHVAVHKRRYYAGEMPGSLVCTHAAAIKTPGPSAGTGEWPS